MHPKTLRMHPKTLQGSVLRRTLPWRRKEHVAGHESRVQEARSEMNGQCPFTFTPFRGAHLQEPKKQKLRELNPRQVPCSGHTRNRIDVIEHSTAHGVRGTWHFGRRALAR
jgi:hypothetical protein